MNWDLLAALPCYATAVLNTWHVAQCIAILIVSLMQYGVDPYFTHIIGFSLGAHIAGFTGASLKNAMGHSVHRITGIINLINILILTDNKPYNKSIFISCIWKFLKANLVLFFVSVFASVALRKE